MVAKNSNKAADEAKSTEDKDVADSPQVGTGEVQTSEQAAETDVPTAPTEVDETSADKWDEYLDEDDEFLDEVPGAVGTVREGDFDVPFTYLNSDHFDDEKVRTADSDDAEVVKWNVQSTVGDGGDEKPVALVPKEATPGQTFTLSELPDPEVMRAAGINVAQYLSGLPVRAERTDEPHRRGIPA